MKQAGLKEELKICSRHKKQGYCYWGVCRHCGVKQFIKKLQTGEIEHDEKKHEKFKEFVVSNE